MNIDKSILELVNKEEESLDSIFKNIDKLESINSKKVLNAFIECGISEHHLNGTNGYGYNDVGRDAIERVFSRVLKGEDSLVRNQFISGTHALTTALFALLRPNDTLLSITGTPYDTLHKVIGITNNDSSLISYGINYEQIDLIDNDFNYEVIKNTLTNKKIKVIEIQRSKGYSTRKSITINQIEKVIKFIKSIDSSVIILVDNCYCEFVSDKTPLEVGANLIVGSLIKNLGAGIASNGAYISGDSSLIELCAERLNVPGQGKEVGPSLNSNRDILKGLFMAPSVVASSIKTAILASKVMESLGYIVSPRYNEERADIVENIVFGNKEDLIKFVQGIQAGSPIDSNSTPIPSYMPGYDNDIIMASGSFTQGSSIELSCDGPLREPYIAYLQGGLTYSYGKLGLISAIQKLKKS